MTVVKSWGTEGFEWGPPRRRGETDYTKREIEKGCRLSRHSKWGSFKTKHRENRTTTEAREKNEKSQGGKKNLKEDLTGRCVLQADITEGRLRTRGWNATGGGKEGWGKRGVIRTVKCTVFNRDNELKKGPRKMYSRAAARKNEGKNGCSRRWGGTCAEGPEKRERQCP